MKGLIVGSGWSSRQLAVARDKTQTQTQTASLFALSFANQVHWSSSCYNMAGLVPSSLLTQRVCNLVFVFNLLQLPSLRSNNKVIHLVTRTGSQYSSSAFSPFLFFPIFFSLFSYFSKYFIYSRIRKKSFIMCFPS